jgi:hypothetical protein
VATIPSRQDLLKPENTNDGFATQSFYHRFVVRVFHDLANVGEGTKSSSGAAADHADYDHRSG